MRPSLHLCALAAFFAAALAEFIINPQPEAQQLQRQSLPQFPTPEEEQLLQEQQQQQQQHHQLPALANENDLPKVITKKSVQDEEDTIQAVESYDFEFLPAEPPQVYHPPPPVQQIPVQDLDALTSATDDHSSDHYHDHHKIGYSAGGPLVNIAQGAAQQAKNFEKSQPAAAAQAAYVAKNRLGQSAGLSAATAAAAFAGKQIIYRGLQQQAYNAHRALESEKLQLQQAQRAATAAAHAAQQAMHQVQVITTALNAAQATSEHASAAASEAAAELAAQTAMVGAAKARLQAIENQLYHAKIDFEAAQSANMKAAAAAQMAQNNAAAAAAHAAEVANANHHDHDDDPPHHHSSHEDHGQGSYPHSRRSHHSQYSKKHQDDDEDHDETVNVPVTSIASTENRDIDRTGRVLHSVASPEVTLASLPNSKEEIYDFNDSFPY